MICLDIGVCVCVYVYICGAYIQEAFLSHPKTTTLLNMTCVDICVNACVCVCVYMWGVSGRKYRSFLFPRRDCRTLEYYTCSDIVVCGCVCMCIYVGRKYRRLSCPIPRLWGGYS